MTRWCILRTSGGQTLPLMRSLQHAGFTVWTPGRVIRRINFRGTRSERHVELDIPILPTFVFAAEADLSALADAATWSVSPHPAFSVFRHGGKIPLISDRDVAGLREEEARLTATAQAIRDAESHDAAEVIRIAALKTETARRRATRQMQRARLTGLRSMRPGFSVGDYVEVAEMPAMRGVTGVVQSIDGASAWVCFGSNSWKIENWRLTPHA